MSAPVAHRPAIDLAAGEMHALPGAPPPRADAASDGGMAVPTARAIDLYAARRRRQEFLPEVADLFHEPAWDMLLDLFVAGESGDSVPAASAGIGADVPATTALRTLAALQDRNVVIVEPDPFDAARHCARLSPAARQRMADYLTTI